MPEIVIKNLRVSYHLRHKDVLALDQISATFPSGKTSVIIGESGSGKSTLSKTILGFLPYEGEIYVGGSDLQSFLSHNSSLSYVSQEFALYPFMSNFDNIAFPLKNIGANHTEIRERVEEIARQLRISACLNYNPREISLGQQQRVAIARALVKEPDLALFDEPLSNLDVKSRLGTRGILAKHLAKAGKTTIYVTHDIEEAMVFADRIFVMDKGKICAEGVPMEIYDSLNPVVRSLVHAHEKENEKFGF